MHITPKTRARAGINGLAAGLAMFGLLSSPLGFSVSPRASAEPLAAAITISAPYPFTEVDTVLIDEPGYKLGGDGYTNGHPDEPALVTWSQNWFGPVPELTGKFHFDGAERCAQVKMISYDAAGVQIGSPDLSDLECPGDLGHHARVVTEFGNDGVVGRAGAASVKIVLQTQNFDGSFGNAGNRTVTYGPTLDTDSVQVLSTYADIGSGVYSNGKPSGSATLTWTSTGGPVTPSLIGTIYIENSHDVCFRTKVTYKKHDGTQLEPPRTGTERCMTDDLLHQYPVNMSAFSNNEVFEITYNIEKKGGSGVWEEVGPGTTAQLGDPRPIINTNPNPGFP